MAQWQLTNISQFSFTHPTSDESGCMTPSSTLFLLFCCSKSAKPLFDFLIVAYWSYGSALPPPTHSNKYRRVVVLKQSIVWYCMLRWSPFVESLALRLVASLRVARASTSLPTGKQALRRPYRCIRALYATKRRIHRRLSAEGRAKTRQGH